MQGVIDPSARRFSPAAGRLLIPFAAALLLAGLAVGCQAPLPPSGPTAVIVDVADYQTFVDRSLSTLRRLDFPPAFVDRERGLIVSQPTTSGQWFEFWRGDSLGAYQSLESSLHTMRRVVTVELQPVDGQSVDLAAAAEPATPGTTAGGAAALADQVTPPADVAASSASAVGVPTSAPANGRFRVSVRVDKSRLNAPYRQVTTASGALAIYSERLPTTEGVRASSRDVQWTPLGRDALLEARVLQELTGCTVTPQTAEPETAKPETAEPGEPNAATPAEPKPAEPKPSGQ